MDAEGRESRRKTGVTGVSGHSECWLGSEGRTNSRIYITKRGPIGSAGCHTKEINEQSSTEGKVDRPNEKPL